MTLFTFRGREVHSPLHSMSKIRFEIQMMESFLAWEPALGPKYKAKFKKWCLWVPFTVSMSLWRGNMIM